MNRRPHDAVAVDSFYHLIDPVRPGRSCRGLACFAARLENLSRWQSAQSGSSLYCLGQCYEGPAAFGQDRRPIIEVQSRETVLLGNVVAGGVPDLKTYCQRGGGAALHKALSTPRHRILDAIHDSGLRGRGGAGFPTAVKWKAVADQSAAVKYVVANADEGDPGAFSDRFLLEDDPFRLIEALVIAGVTVGARQGYIYLRKEYPGAAIALQNALAEAYAAGWLGASVLGSGSRFDLALEIGRGSYVCGEETAMLNALEGKRPEPRPRPPQITEYGLYGAPTLVNNVETLCAVPWIVERGGKAYADMGTPHSKGTKLLSLNSRFQRPGLYEVEFGTPLRDIVERIGGGLRNGTLKALMVGGPLAALIPPSLLDTLLGYEEMQAIGAAVGHGGVIAFGDDTRIDQILAEVFRFGADESCGKCVPCHRGAPRLAAMFAGAATGSPAHAVTAAGLIDALEATSLCGHGRGLAEFARGVARHFPEEWRACFA